jgi:thiamine biosynthesis lipoprotein
MSDWQRYVHHEHVWGTVVTFDVRALEIDERAVKEACAAASQELHRIDAWLSPFRADSEVSAIRRGELSPKDVSAPVAEVLAGCAAVTGHSAGAFDPWAAPGGFDPSGFVKGWGADRAAEILVGHGFVNVSVNAAGDVTCRGSSAPDHRGWRIGIADPGDPAQIIGSVEVVDAHLATSGRYEQGDHIVDPATGRRVTSVDSASVLARDGGHADAWATALLVRGPAALPALAHEADVSAMVISGGYAWVHGPAFARERLLPAG